MGYNRAGNRAKQKLRRTRKEQRRLSLKAAAAQEGGVVKTVKRVATKAVAAVGKAVEVVKEKITGKSD
jgi:hypothetical protein